MGPVCHGVLLVVLGWSSSDRVRWRLSVQMPGARPKTYLLVVLVHANVVAKSSAQQAEMCWSGW